MERDKKIIEMYSNDISATEISNELNIGRRTVYRILAKNDVLLHNNKKITHKCLACGKECNKTLCGVCYTNLRRYRVKLKAVNYLGGKCLKCGWAGNLSGFDFHHRDPNEKDFEPSAASLANKSWEIVKEELDKCDLLCAICHRNEHNNYSILENLNLVYIGKLFK